MHVIRTRKMDYISKLLNAIIALLLTLSLVSGKMCSYKKAKPVVTNIVAYKPCVKSYRDSCSWFSLSYCTFYKSEICREDSNTTSYTYHTVMDCCKGYIMAPNQTCVQESKILNEPWYLKIQNTTTEPSVYINPGDIVTLPNVDITDDDSVKDTDTKVTKIEKKNGGLSHGVYAGIACSLLFIGIVVVLTYIGIRKKRRQRPNKRDEHAEPLTTQRQLSLQSKTEQL